MEKMVIPIKKILLEATHRIQTNGPNNLSQEDIINHTNGLYSQLDILSKKYNIPKDKLLIFGSVALGLKGLRKPNDLDIGIHPEYLKNLKQDNKPTKGSYGSHYDIGNLSFIHQQALPKLNGQNLFDLENLNRVNGYNTINFDHWKEMQRNDPLQKDKRFLNESVTPNSNIHIHGESHFNPEEVNRIRQTVIQNKPDVIIHELDDDMDLYKKHLPGTRLYQLERGLDQKIYKYFPNDYASQFKHREDNMIRNIENIRQFHPGANIHIVVGDTHLRTIPTKELGDSSPFHKYDYNIYRSRTPEIK